MVINIHAPNGQLYQIRSRSLETIGRWFLETLTEIRPEPAHPCQLQVFPTWDPETGRPDWIADSRVLGRLLPFTSLREALKVLAQQIDDAEALNAG